MNTKLLLFCLLLAAAGSVSAQSTTQKAEQSIRKYWFVLLTTGPTRNQDSTTAAKIQEAHLANIGKLYADGKVKVAGPFEGDEDWQGLFIFDAKDMKEVEDLLRSDPAIAAGRLLYTIKPWYTVATGSFTPGKPKTALF
jgi:uncharacterized protein YciI